MSVYKTYWSAVSFSGGVFGWEVFPLLLGVSGISRELASTLPHELVRAGRCDKRSGAAGPSVGGVSVITFSRFTCYVSVQIFFFSIEFRWFLSFWECVRPSELPTFLFTVFP